MKAEELLNLLEETAERLTVKLDYDDVRKGVVTSYGDSYILRGERRILIDKSLDTGERADLLIKILAKFDTEGVFLAPEVRTRIDEARADEERRNVREADELMEAKEEGSEGSYDPEESEDSSGEETAGSAE